MAKTKVVKMTWLELARRRAGQSRKEAAVLAGLSVRSWEGWEQGAHRPSLLAIEKLEWHYPVLREHFCWCMVRVNPKTLEVVL